MKKIETKEDLDAFIAGGITPQCCADLKLHETLKIGNAEYERVPGGWVRVEARACVGITSCFICEPEDGAIMCRPIGFQQEDL